MRSHFCPIWQYNKEKPNTFIVSLLVLEDAKDYLINNIDVYQGNLKNEIKEETQNTPTTKKDVTNSILSAGIENYPEGHHITF